MTFEHLLPRTTPEAQGIASSAILAFLQDVDVNIHDLHSFMLLRHGAVVAEGWWVPYARQTPHMLFSLSKSFTSTAVGLAVAEGCLSVDEPLLKFFPEEAPAKPSRNLAAMRVRHLLSMSTGHAEDTTSYMHRRQDGNWVKAFLARPVKFGPGTHFLYNSGATYMLSAIVQKLTGMTVLDYLRPRLFEPLGIQNPTWESCPRGINFGGWGLSISTEDIARFGQLYLQKGMWRGKRLLPKAWVEEATSKQVSNGSKEDSDWEQGYGYQFWRCRHGMYRGDGAFGQYCIVMPDQDAVVAITSGVSDMQAVLDLVWKHLLPAMGPIPLPENHPAQEELARTLECLSIPAPQGEPDSPLAEKVSGKEYVFEANPAKFKTVRFDFSQRRGVYTLRAGRRVQQVSCGYGTWLKGKSHLDWRGLQPLAASGAWTSEDNYLIKLCFYETPFIQTVACHFTEGQVSVELQQNVSLMPLETLHLVGRISS